MQGRRGFKGGLVSKLFLQEAKPRQRSHVYFEAVVFSVFCLLGGRGRGDGRKAGWVDGWMDGKDRTGQGRTGIKRKKKKKRRKKRRKMSVSLSGGRRNKQEVKNIHPSPSPSSPKSQSWGVCPRCTLVYIHIYT